MMSIRQVLADYIRHELQARNSNWTVSDRYRDVTSHRASRKARHNVMGDPERYAEVLHVNDVAENAHFDSLTAAHRQQGTPHRFMVNIWRLFEDADQVASSSQPEWDEAIWATAAAHTGDHDGLVPSLRTVAHLKIESDQLVTSGGEVFSASDDGIFDEPAGTIIHLDQPTDAQDDIARLGSGKHGEIAHYCQFFITCAAN